MAATQGQRETVTVAAEEAGGRLDRVLAARVTALSRTRLKALILAGRVAIGGATIRNPGHRVNTADTVTVEVPVPEAATPRGEQIPLTVVHEDADLIVI